MVDLDEENVTKPWKEFLSILEKRNYKNLKITSDIFKEETHISVWPASFTKGLKIVFSTK